MLILTLYCLPFCGEKKTPKFMCGFRRIVKVFFKTFFVLDAHFSLNLGLGPVTHTCRHVIKHEFDTVERVFLC